MSTPDRRSLWRSVFRQTGRDPSRVGHWLRRHRRNEGLPPAALARTLGIDLEGLALLSLCDLPREAQFGEDLAVICQRTGASESVLGSILRQERALARWSERPPVEQGWLMAASDAELPEPEEPEKPGEGHDH
jgi:hypothetical protein